LSPYIDRGLHKDPWVDHIVKDKAYQKAYSSRRLEQFREGMLCPKCDQVCEEMVMLWASGPLLGTRADMDDVADAIIKVYENRDKLGSM
jgi:hypothetical protein